MSMATIKYDNNGNELMRITHLDNTINEFVKGIVADSTGAFYLFSEYDGHLFLAKYK